MSAEHPVLRRGSQGPEVVDLQDRLKALGWTAIGPSDGDFGAMTEAVVQTFQASIGLHPIDGIVGDDTWTALSWAESGKSPLAIELPGLDLAPCSPWIQRLLQTAANELGVMEIPNGSNGGPRVDVYTGRWRVAWCSLFVSWCIRQQPDSPIEKPISATIRWVEWLKARKSWHTNASKRPPRPGDLFCILVSGKAGVDSGFNHIGFVVAWDAKTRTILTIEGNTANAVRCMRRPISDISGWGHVHD